MLGADRNGQRRDDGQGEWNPQGHPGADAGFGIDFDDAADPLDVGANDIHPDAAAGDRGHFLGSRKPRFEYQGELLARSKCCAVGLVHQARCNGLFYQFLAIDAAPIVDLDQDLIPDCRATDSMPISRLPALEISPAARYRDRPHCG